MYGSGGGVDNMYGDGDGDDGMYGNGGGEDMYGDGGGESDVFGGGDEGEYYGDDNQDKRDPAHPEQTPEGDRGGYGDYEEDDDLQEGFSDGGGRRFCGCCNIIFFVQCGVCLLAIGGVVAGIIIGVQSRRKGPAPVQIEEDPIRGPRPTPEPTPPVAPPATQPTISPRPTPELAAIPQDMGDCSDLCAGRGGDFEFDFELDVDEFPRFELIQSMVDVRTCGLLQDNLAEAASLFSATTPGVDACAELRKLGTYCGCNDVADADPPTELCSLCAAGSTLVEPSVFFDGTDFEAITGFRPDCQFWQDWALSNYAQDSDECDKSRAEATDYCACSEITMTEFPSVTPSTIPVPTKAPAVEPAFDCNTRAALHELYFIGNVGLIGENVTIEITMASDDKNRKSNVKFSRSFDDALDILAEGERGIYVGCLQRQSCFDVTIAGGTIEDLDAAGGGVPVEWGLWNVPDQRPVASGFAQPGKCSFTVPAKRPGGKELACENTCAGNELSKYTPAPTPTSQLLMPRCNKKQALHVLSFTGVEDGFASLGEEPGVFLSGGGHLNLTAPPLLDPVEFIEGLSTNTFLACMRRQRCSYITLSGQGLPQTDENGESTGWSLRLASDIDGTPLPGKPAASGLLEAHNEWGCYYFVEPKIANELAPPCETTCMKGEMELYTPSPTVTPQPTTLPPTPAPTMRAFAENGLCPPTTVLHVLEIQEPDQQFSLDNSIMFAEIADGKVKKKRPVYTVDFGPISLQETHFVCLKKNTCFTPVFSGIISTDSPPPGWALWPVPLNEENPNRLSMLPVASGVAGPTDCTFAVPPIKEGKRPACPTTCTEGERVTALDRITSAPTISSGPTAVPVVPPPLGEGRNYGCPTRPKMILFEIVFLDALGWELVPSSFVPVAAGVEVVVNYPPNVGKNDTAIWSSDVSMSIESNEPNYMCIQRNRCHTVRVEVDSAPSEAVGWELRKVSFEEDDLGSATRVAASGIIVSGEELTSCTFALPQKWWGEAQPCPNTCTVDVISEDHCEACPEGLSDPNKATSLGGTCGELLSQAMSFAADDESCRGIQNIFVTECGCAPEEGFCDVCLGGAPESDRFIDVVGVTCDVLVTQAFTVQESDTETCDFLQGIAATECGCTNNFSTCQVCPDGLPEEDMFSELSNMTCSEVLSVADFFSSDSGTCAGLQLISVIECGCSYSPPTVTGDDCSLCVGGTPVPDPFLTLDPTNPSETSCGYFEWSAVVGFDGPSPDCVAFQATAGAACGCPDPPAPACDVSCPEGQTFSFTKMIEDTFDVGNNGMVLCGLLLGMFSGEDFLCTAENKLSLIEGGCCVNENSNIFGLG